MAEHRYVLRVECKDLGAQVTWNGCAVFEAWDRDGRVVQHPLDPWVIEGKNRLEARLSPLAARPGEEPEEPVFKLALHRAPAGAEPWDGTVLSEFAWTENEAALSPGVWTTVFVHELQAAPSAARWDLKDARPPADHERLALTTLVASVHAALAAKDLASLEALFDTKITDVANGLGIPRREAGEDFAAELRAWFAEADFHVEPLALASLDFTGTAGGRLVHARTASGAPPIRGRAGGRDLGMSLTLAHQRGAFRVVR